MTNTILMSNRDARWRCENELNQLKENIYLAMEDDNFDRWLVDAEKEFDRLKSDVRHLHKTRKMLNNINYEGEK